MNNFDLEQFLQFLSFILVDDRYFYGLVGIAFLLLLLIVWRLLPFGKTKAEKDEKEDPSQLVDQVMDQILTDEKSADRIDEPHISYAESDQEETPDPYDDDTFQRATDTVEVYSRLSSDSTEDGEYGVSIIGEKALEKIPPSAPALEEEPKPKPAPKPKPEPEIPPQPKSLQDGLAKTKKSGFIGRLNTLVFGERKIDTAVLDELEEILYEADIGATATRLFESIAEQCKSKELKDAKKIRSLLKQEISSILIQAEKPYNPGSPTPHVILMVGVNGVGKTTTIGKLARKYIDEGKSVMLAAGDTFRAAAVEQLSIWGERAQAQVITAKEGANPSGVLFNAVQSARTKGVDILIADTAGRLHTKYNLMEELKKMKAVTAKALGREADEIWLVIDANTGQNAVNQAAKFNEALGLTGLVLTKLDGTAKGGVVIGITDQLKLPIRFIGIGEGVGDLRPFKAGEFVEALFQE